MKKKIAKRDKQLENTHTSKMEAYVYCIPLSADIVKIGSHLGSEKELDARYGTYVTKSQLAAKELIPVEAEDRKHFERVIQRLLKRLHDGAYFIEKEKFKTNVIPVFASLRGQFAKPPSTDVAQGITMSNLDARLNQIKIEKKAEKIAAHEKQQRDHTYAFCKEIVYEMADAAVEHYYAHNDPYNRFVKSHLVKTTCKMDRCPYNKITARYHEWAKQQGIEQLTEFTAKSFKAVLVQYIGCDYMPIAMDGKTVKGWKYLKLNE